MRPSSEFRKLFSVCAICTVECVLRCADCTVECVTPELSRLGRFAGPGPCGLGLSRMLADGRAGLDRQQDRRTAPDRRPGPRKSRTGTGGPNRTAPDRHGGRTGTGTGPRRTGSGASRRTGPAARRRRPAPMACTAGPKPETASTSTRARTGARGDAGELLPGGLKRRLKTGAPNSARQEAGTARQPRRRGFMRAV